MTPENIRLHGSKKAPTCKACYQESNQKWLSENREHRKHYNRKWKMQNEVHVKEEKKRWDDEHRGDYMYEYHLKRMYGLTKDDYDRLLEAQNNGCAICGNPCDIHKKLSADHDHQTGRVRGLLCHRCNTGLGCFRDDPNRLLKAVEYLMREQ